MFLYLQKDKEEDKVDTTESTVLVSCDLHESSLESDLINTSLLPTLNQQKQLLPLKSPLMLH